MSLKKLLYLIPILFMGFYFVSCGESPSTLTQPTISLDSGTYLKGEKFTITHPDSVKYLITDDGSEPDPANALISAGTMTVTLNSTKTYKIIAVKDDEISETVTRNFTVTENPNDENNPIEIRENVKYSADLSLTAGAQMSTPEPGFHFIKFPVEAGKRYLLHSFIYVVDGDNSLLVYSSKADMIASLADMKQDWTDDDLSGVAGDLYNTNQLNGGIYNKALVKNDDFYEVLSAGVIFKATVTGYYYAIIKSYDDATFSSYNFILTELNNDTTTPLTVDGDTYSATLGGATIRNIFRVDMIDTQNYGVSIVPTTDLSSTDQEYNLACYKISTGEFVSLDDLSTPNATDSISFTADSTDTYYCLVVIVDYPSGNALSYDGTGSYNINVTTP